MLDDFTKEAAKGRSSLREEDLQLWNQWKQGGEKPNDLRPLLSNFRGMIRKQSNQFARNVELPPNSIHAEFTKQAVNAFRSYDPNKGAALGTWVTTNIQKGKRWVSTYQNPARIGEHRIYKIGQFESAKSQLDERFGREPTQQEMAEYLSWSPREVGRMGSEIRKAHIESSYEGDPTTITPSIEMERLRLVKHELSPEEKLVYEYTIGDGGKPELKPGQIAKKMKISPSKVTRIRTNIFNRVMDF